MSLKNSTDGYGLAARLLHWLMAIAIIAMFGLGYWMVTLDYYSPWYKSAPDLHKSAGLILLGLLAIRFAWRLANLQPDDSYLKPIERSVSKLVHRAFYLLLLTQMTFGYLISTADGRSIEIFGLVSLPSLIQSKGLEDFAGLVHEVLAYCIIGLAAVHAGAALKHHFIDRDPTLKRMWSGN
jgi:cytochrome b561